MRRSTEARNLLAQLDSELAQSSVAAGQTLVWSAAEAEVLTFVAASVDRKCALARDYDKAGSPSLRLSIAAEIRLLETHIARLLTQVRTDLPVAPAAPASATSTKASKAANTRWKAERLRKSAEVRNAKSS